VEVVVTPLRYDVDVYCTWGEINGNTSVRRVGALAKAWNWQPPEYTPEVLPPQLTCSVRVPHKLIVACLSAGYGHYAVPIKRIEFTSFNFNIILPFKP